MVLLLVVPAVGSPGLGDTEEFVGPFPSWKNAKTDYGAVGDGEADDTAALQKALDDLRLHRDSCVLYLPAGTYRITGTIRTVRKAHRDGMGIAVVGEDPARTVVRWDGEPGGTMVQYDAWYSRISRITLDGAGRAAVGLNYGPAFSTYNETSDMVFQDLAVGLRMGGGGNGQAENEVLRCTFRRLSKAGVLTVDFNSMDIWVWNSRFEDCEYGLYNGAGNFHAWGNLFLRSRTADIGTANLMVFSFVNNTSIGSRCFLDFSGGHTWGAQTSITGNRIIEPAGDWAIRLGNGGPYLVMDNVIKSRPGVARPVVEMTWGDQVFVGNTYTVPGAVKEAGRFRRIDEKVVDPGAIDVPPAGLPGTPPRRDRRLFDLEPGAGAAAIQQAVDEAARLKGRRPVVHLPKGTYRIDRTIVIPAGCDLRLVGDGAAETATVLEWTGPAGGLMMKLRGPSRAILRDLSLHGPNASGIRIENCDQQGGSVFADQLNVSGMGPSQRCRACVRVSGVAESDVLLRCLQGAAHSRAWVEVAGRAGSPGGLGSGWAAGQISILNGATGTADAQYAVSGGGSLIVRGVYHEMDAAAPQAVLLAGAGSLTIDATRFSYKTSPERPLFAVDGFRGRFSMLTSLFLPVNSTHTAQVSVSGDGSRCQVLCMASTFWVNEPGVNAGKVWADRSRPPARAAMVLSNVNSGLEGATKNGFGRLEDRGRGDDAFLLRMLEPLRECRIWLPGPRPESVTDVRLHRVICRAGRDGVAVELRAGE